MLSSRDDLWCLPAQINISVFPWVASLCWTSQSSNSRQKPFLWGNPCWTHSPEWKLVLRESLPDHMDRDSGERVPILPTGFSESDFSFSWGAESFQFISGFLTKGFFLWIVAELVWLWGEGGFRASYSAIYWCYFPVFYLVCVLRVLCALDEFQKKIIQWIKIESHFNLCYFMYQWIRTFYMHVSNMHFLL